MNTQKKAFEILLMYYKILTKNEFSDVKRCAECYIDGIIHTCCDVDNIGYWSEVNKEIRYINKSMFLENLQENENN